MALSRQTQRRLAFGGNATIVSAVAVGIAIVLYAIVDLNRLRLDLSADQGSVLMPDTRNKLKLLDTAGTPVVITGFSAQEGKKESYFKNRAMRDLLEELDYNSSVVETHFVDFDKERLTAEKLGVTDYGSVVIQRGDERIDLRDRDVFRRKGGKGDVSIDFLGETAINRAVAQLLSDEKRVVYALVGHGELDIENAGPDGAADLKKLLDGDGYELKPLDLVRDRTEGNVPRVPDDAAAVMVMRPRVQISAIEEDLLLAYLSTGGSLLFSLEPDGFVSSLLGRVGVSVPSGRVLDTMLVFPYPDRPIPKYKSSPIVRDLAEAQMITEVAGVAPVQAASPAMEGVRASTMLETSRDGWIERGGELAAGKAVYQPEIDGQGPAAMAISLEISRDSGLVKKGLGHMVVLGDSDVLANSLLGEGPGNATFALNCVRWLVGDEARLSVVGKPSSVRRLAFTEDDRGKIMWAALGIGPMLVVIGGAAMWAARRGR